MKRNGLRSPLVSAVAVGLALLSAGGPAGGQGSPQTSSLTILIRDGRRALPLSVLNDQEFVLLDDLATAFQLSVREESFGALTVGYKGKTILLTPDQPLASVAGRLVSLPAAPMRSGRRWAVPVEFINRALSLIYDTRLELRKPAHLVIVGDLRVPRVSVRLESSDPVRLIIDASPRTSSTVSQESNNTLAVKFEADALDVTVPPVQPQGFIQAIRVAESATIVIDLGPRFTSFRAATQPIDTVARLTIDFTPAQADAQPAQPVQAPPASPAPDLSVLGQPITSVRTVAIDPGHGGEDQGVRSANGTTEKDLVLAVARRVKTAIESRLGIRVLLTRDDDRNVSLDGRAALANNNKADLLISLHANASFRKTMTGASVLYATFSRQIMQAAGGPQGSERLPAFGGGTRDLDLVPWDLAQIRHVDRSGELARILDAQFKDRIPLTAHPVERAPLSVLEACNMPAVAVEMGYLTNPEQEKQMVGAEFQNAFTQAVYDAVLKFRDVLGSGGTH